MYEHKPITTLEPKLTLVCDEKPPLGTKLYLVSKDGIGILGDYHPEWGIVAWSLLPKLTTEQKKRLEELSERHTHRS